MLDKTKLILLDERDRGHKVYLYKCLDCNVENKITSSNLKSSKGLCHKCAVSKYKLRPFEANYNHLVQRNIKHRNMSVDLTYEEYLEFTNIDKCSYCKFKINWSPFRIKKDKGTTAAYFLDRKDNNLGYSKDNCIVCCGWCNHNKSNRFTYEEFSLLSPILIKIRENRLLKEGKK